MAAKDNVIAKMADKNAMHLLETSNNFAPGTSDDIRRAYGIERNIDQAATDLDTSLTSMLKDIKALQEFLKGERGYTSSGLSRYGVDANIAMAKLTTLMPMRKYHSHLLPR